MIVHGLEYAETIRPRCRAVLHSFN